MGFLAQIHFLQKQAILNFIEVNIEFVMGHLHDQTFYSTKNLSISSMILPILMASPLWTRLVALILNITVNNTDAFIYLGT